jgi:hypothetical protein
MQHDLPGLEAALMKQYRLECALRDLCDFQRLYKETLTAKQRVFLDTAIHTTACLFHDMLEAPSDHWSGESGCHEDCPACQEEVDAERRRREP